MLNILGDCEGSPERCFNQIDLEELDEILSGPGYESVHRLVFTLKVEMWRTRAADPARRVRDIQARSLLFLSYHLPKAAARDVSFIVIVDGP